MYGWLTGNEIHKQVKLQEIIINPFDPNMLNPNSYNYHLDKKMLKITNDIIDMNGIDEFEEFELAKDGTILLPHECYLGTTVEFFGSDSYASLVTGRSSVGRKFATNHVTAGLIDQGFFGRITLEITVSKPTIVYPNMVFGQIFWFTVCGDPVLYNGKYQFQDKPTISKIYYENEKYKED